MEILVRATLNVAPAGGDVRLLGVAVEQVGELVLLPPRHAFGCEACRHPLERLADEEELLEGIAVEGDHPHADPRSAHDEPALKPMQGLAQRPPADPELARQLRLGEALTRQELA